MNIALRRAALAVYLLFILWAMLWPQLRLPETDIPRPDLLAHLGVFGLLTVLTILARAGGAPTLGPRNIATGALIALAIASTLEAVQAIPALNRTSGWDDALANALGVAGATVVFLLLGALEDPARTEGAR